MGKAKSYYLKNSGKEFDTKEKLKEYLRDIRETADKNPNGEVLDLEHIAALKDFLSDFHDDSDNILLQFDLDNCGFRVDFPPIRRNKHKCLYIYNQKNPDEKRQFSTNNFGNPSNPLRNFRAFCRETVRENKRKIREHLVGRENVGNFDLWHEKIPFKEIVDRFIDAEKLADDLHLVISENGDGHNVPQLQLCYAYLEKKFIDFYMREIERAGGSEAYTLKPAKN